MSTNFEVRDENISLIDKAIAEISARIVAGDYADEPSLFIGRDNAIKGDLAQLLSLAARRAEFLIAERNK